MKHFILLILSLILTAPTLAQNTEKKDTSTTFYFIRHAEKNRSDKENKIFEARVSVPGDSFIVKKQCKSFEEGTDMAVASLERQLKKRKEKLRAHL